MTLPVVLESGAVCSRNYVSGCCSPWSRTLAMFTRTAFVLASVMSPCYRHVCQKPKWALAVFHFGCKSNRVMRNYWNWLSLNCPTLSGAFAHQFGGSSAEHLGLEAQKTFTCGTSYACCILSSVRPEKRKLAIHNCANALSFLCLPLNCCAHAVIRLQKYFLPPHMKGTWMRIPSTVLNLTDRKSVV